MRVYAEYIRIFACIWHAHACHQIMLQNMNIICLHGLLREVKRANAAAGRTWRRAGGGISNWKDFIPTLLDIFSSLALWSKNFIIFLKGEENGNRRDNTLLDAAMEDAAVFVFLWVVDKWKISYIRQRVKEENQKLYMWEIVRRKSMHAIIYIVSSWKVLISFALPRSILLWTNSIC